MTNYTADLQLGDRIHSTTLKNSSALESDLLFVLASSVAWWHKHIPAIWLCLGPQNCSCLWAAPSALRHSRRTHTGA